MKLKNKIEVSIGGKIPPEAVKEMAASASVQGEIWGQVLFVAK